MIFMFWIYSLSCLPSSVFKDGRMNWCADIWMDERMDVWTDGRIGGHMGVIYFWSHRIFTVGKKKSCAVCRCLRSDRYYKMPNRWILHLCSVYSLVFTIAVTCVAAKKSDKGCFLNWKVLFILCELKYRNKWSVQYESRWHMYESRRVHSELDSSCWYRRWQFKI